MSVHQFSLSKCVCACVYYLYLRLMEAITCHTNSYVSAHSISSGRQPAMRIAEHICVWWSHESCTAHRHGCDRACMNVLGAYNEEKPWSYCHYRQAKKPTRCVSHVCVQTEWNTKSKTSQNRNNELEAAITERLQVSMCSVYDCLYLCEYGWPCLCVGVEWQWPLLQPRSLSQSTKCEWICSQRQRRFSTLTFSAAWHTFLAGAVDSRRAT